MAKPKPNIVAMKGIYLSDLHERIQELITDIASPRMLVTSTVEDRKLDTIENLLKQAEKLAR